mmetsp:Transcript_16595/g.49829  ORF Transcript_16595/g.49829 Transcript_16595/m.49829 type:complete len:238 (-) Transcript_16595:221-934(-)
MLRCTHRLTRRLYSFFSSSDCEKCSCAASGLRWVAGSGEGSAESKRTSAESSACSVSSLASQQCHTTSCRMNGTPCGLICGWNIGVTKRTKGGASGKVGGKTNSTWNMPPSHSVSAGPKIVASQTAALASSAPMLAPSTDSDLSRSSCCRKWCMQLVTDASRPACSIAVCCAPCRRHSSTSVMSDACSFSRRAWSLLQWKEPWMPLDAHSNGIILNAAFSRAASHPQPRCTSAKWRS